MPAVLIAVLPVVVNVESPDTVLLKIVEPAPEVVVANEFPPPAMVLEKVVLPAAEFNEIPLAVNVRGLLNVILPPVVITLAPKFNALPVNDTLPDVELI